MVNKRLLTAVTMAVVLLPGTISPTYAQDDPFLKRGNEGWFFYNELEEPEPLELQKIDPPVPPQANMPPPEPLEIETEVTVVPPQGPAPLSAEWLKENLPRYLNNAIDNPTDENVLAYALLQKHATNKASAFREKYQTVTYGNPYLDENSNRPIATEAARFSDQLADESKKDMLRQLAKTAGVWFFYHSECQFCLKQAPILESLERLYGFHITAISIDGMPLPTGHFPNFKTDQGQAAKLNVTRTPTIILAKPPNDYIVVSNGIITASSFAERSLQLAHQAGWINQDEFDKTRVLKVTRTTGTDLTPLQKLYGKDFDPEAQEIVDYFKKQIIGGSF